VFSVSLWWTLTSTTLTRADTENVDYKPNKRIILIGVLLRMSAANSFVGAIHELWIVLNTQFELMLPPLISQI